MTVVNDVGRFAWWAAGTEGVDVAGWWLPTEPEDRSDLARALSESLSGYQWLLVSTWHRRLGEEARGFEARWPGLARQVVARNESGDPRGLAALTEWCVADPASEHLFEFLEGLRRSRGKGSSAALAEDGASLRSWVALSGGTLWRCSAGMNLDSSLGYENLQHVISRLQLTELTRHGYISLVPLDLHPEGGFALLGRSRQISAMSELSEERLADVPLLDGHKVLDRAGGLAL